MSCRHSLANGTCTTCYPRTGTYDPGPERNYGPNLDGPGAVPLALKLFYNGTERVVAVDEYEARDIVVKDLGCLPDEVEAFEEVPDLDASLTIDCEGLKVTLTGREWIAKEGRGLLSSHEMP